MILRCCLTLCVLAGPATADLLCETTGGDIRFEINEAAQTITMNDLPPMPYRPRTQPLAALFGTVTLSVAVPDAHPGTRAADASATLVFAGEDAITLRDNFSSYLSPNTALAFASVSDIMDLVRGVPCIRAGG